jgi:hypothetical protein
MSTRDPLRDLPRIADLIRRHGDPDLLWYAGWMERCAPQGEVWEDAPSYAALPAARRAKRNQLLRTLRLPASRVARELANYYSTEWTWAWDAAECPHEEGSPEAVYWHVLQLWPAPLGREMLKRILR